MVKIVLKHRSIAYTYIAKVVALQVSASKETKRPRPTSSIIMEPTQTKKATIKLFSTLSSLSQSNMKPHTNSVKFIESEEEEEKSVDTILCDDDSESSVIYTQKTPKAKEKSTFGKEKNELIPIKKKRTKSVKDTEVEKYTIENLVKLSEKSIFPKRTFVIGNIFD